MSGYNPAIVFRGNCFAMRVTFFCHRIGEDFGVLVEAEQGERLVLSYGHWAVEVGFNFDVVDSVAVQVEDEGTPIFVKLHDGVVKGNNHVRCIAEVEYVGDDGYVWNRVVANWDGVSRLFSLPVVVWSRVFLA